METSHIRDFDAYHTKVWMLLLLRALNKAGITACNSRMLHKVLYFGNTLARIYEFDPPAEVVMRHPRGPFYPKAQSDLDWLCLVSWASVRDVSYEVIEQFTTRRGVYDISHNGFSIANRFVRDVSWAREIADFLDDLAIAFASIDFEHEEDFVGNDFTYQMPTSETNPVIHFGTIHGNRSFRASEEIKSLVPDGLKPIPQTSLKLYINYLNKLAA